MQACFGRTQAIAAGLGAKEHEQDSYDTLGQW
jgi:hypothetical protein